MGYKISDFVQFNVIDRSWNYEKDSPTVDTFYNVLNEIIDNSNTFLLKAITFMIESVSHTAITFKVYDGDSGIIYHYLYGSSYSGNIILPEPIMLKSTHIKIDVAVNVANNIKCSVLGKII